MERDEFSSDDRISGSDFRESDVHDSRANSLDSEEAALSNGRKTLEEVAAKLNDVEGAEKRLRRVQGSGKRGLLSVDRIPFFSNLFNYRTLNSGIVVDEEDANQEDNPLTDIFIWRFPLVSGLWFLVLQVAFFLVHFCNYSLLSILSFLALWQLVIDLLLVQSVPKLQKTGLVSEDIDIKDVVKRTTYFNAQITKRVASVAHEIADIMIGMWKMTVLEANLSRILIVGRFVFVVFLRSFSVPTTVYLMFMILFTIPISYSTNRIFADAVAGGAQVAAARHFQIIKRFSNGLVSAAANRFQLALESAGSASSSSKQIRMFQASLWGMVLTGAQNFDQFVTKLLG